MATDLTKGGVLMVMRTGQEFEDFVRERSAALLRTAYALVGDYGHAEDLLQTALLRTARRWTAARDAPEAYARRVLVNLCRDRVRWLRRRPPESALTEGVEPADRQPQPAAQVDEQRYVVQALMGLPAGQRQVVVLRFLEDLSVAETADLLGISTGTVKSYTSRALSSLRINLNDNSAVSTQSPAVFGCDAPEVFHAH
ncbi:MAG TPA: SigE family RNA polymerase sigma factor [Streptosporangiaceae bacterium]|jgi:RNA polymerase sigma-70 factor (sigma-E family)|nr:SigE family RNA polymerase sigma factor [Streptosporangiaceae bacterium]